MKHDYTLFRKSRWLWLLTLLMLVPIGSWAQNDTDYELVIEMRDGTKRFAQIVGEYPQLSKTASYNPETEKTSIEIQVELSSTPGDRYYVLRDQVKRLYTQPSTSVTIQAKSYTIYEGDPIPEFEYTTTGVELVGTPVLTCEATAESGPGEYEIVVSRGTVTNENVSFINGTLTILHNDSPVVFVTPDYIEMNYGDAVPELTYTVTGGTINGEPVISCDVTSTSPIGSYEIKSSAGTVTTKNVVYATNWLHVNEAPLTITAKSYTIKQGDPLPNFELEYDGFKNGEGVGILSVQPYTQVMNGSLSLEDSSVPGTYPIIVLGPTNYDGNYLIETVNGTLTITEGDTPSSPIYVKPDYIEMEYGDAIPQLTYTVEGGTINGEPELICEATSTSSVGNYIITASRGTVTTSNVTYQTNWLHIKEAPLTITAKSYTINQGDPMPNFEIEYNGFKNGETVGVLSSQPYTQVMDGSVLIEDSNVPGIFTILVIGPTEQDGNYFVTTVNGTLTVVESLGITTTDADSSMDVFTTTGLLVARGITSLDALPKGVYVIKKTNGKTFKLTRK